ncbi:hypothetical protein KQH54_04580 [bacterium]|nr:hypothetical protein [bacterium]MCB2180376.1 hypothetical protein [bacterium]
MTLKMSEVAFGGYECVKLENGQLELWMTQGVGPRILGLAFQGGENIFAELPGEVISFPGVGDYSLRGGHRLWCAPEKPETTYLPDDKRVTIKSLDDTLHIIQPEDERIGVQKTLSITLDPDEPKVIVNHSLTNTGQDTIELAPWAITQLRLGGVAILPQFQGNVDAHGLLPNRQLNLWPYAKMQSPHVEWGDEYIFVHANFTEGFFKVGFPNSRGWMGYVIADTLFVKKAQYFPGAAYYDLGSSSECYCNCQFLELETLGPKVMLDPGQSVHHREDWVVYAVEGFTPTQAAVQALVDQLGLG